MPVQDFQGDFSQLVQYHFSLDTLNSDLTIHTPSSGKRCAIFGALWVDTNSHTLVWKSNNTNLITMTMPANSGWDKAISEMPTGIITALDEPLKVRLTSGSLTSGMLWVAEFYDLKGS